MIAGSHKIDPTVDTAEIIEAAIADPSLIHHVVAPAGSTLVFFESTIHACASPPSRSALSLSASLPLCVRSCPALLLVLSAKLLVGDSRALSSEPRLGADRTDRRGDSER